MTETVPDWASQAEARLLEAALPLVERMGWSSRAIAAAAPVAGLSVGEAELLLPGGARDLAALWARRCDDEAIAALPNPLGLKIRERIRSAALARMDAAVNWPEATRRWAGFLALPPNAPLGLRLAWESADALWRWAGDTATDENHYSKRALLAEILISTLAVRLASGEDAALAHLDSRIEGVMRFETLKRRLRVGELAPRLAGVLGAIRYGAVR